MASETEVEAAPVPKTSVSEKLKEKLFKKKSDWRALIAYWILGICNNYGYVVMLTAANDILEQNDKSEDNEMEYYDISRECNFISTGAILLADVIPSLIIKMCSPFLPFYINFRMVLVVTFGASGYILVAFGTNQWVSILGVVFTSFCSGLGEATLLQYSSLYDKNVISTWSSGTGAAGIVGALSYALLATLGIRNTLLIMLIVPAIMAVIFWLILPKPKPRTQFPLEEETSATQAKHTFKEKLALMPGLLKFMIPLALVYFFEYFINQGLFELIQFKGIFLDYKSQYRWLQVTYQLGVFISRSSVNLVHIKHIWILAVLQLVNVALFSTEAIFYYTPYFWIVLLFTLWEGLLGGSAYVNTYYTISTDVPEKDRSFSLGITSFADSIGILFAGLISIVAHNAICKLPMPERLLAN